MAKKIPIKGVIVSDDQRWIYDWFGIEATSPGSVSKIIDEADGEDLEIEINSGGGSVFAGSEIYYLIKNSQNKSVGNIVGFAGSAASVIAMAPDVTRIAPTAQIMIHNCSSGAQGDYRDMEHSAEVLKNMNSSIANSYALKTKLSHEELLSMMDKETWLTAQQAKEKGFVDEILFDDANQFVASFNHHGMLPLEVINKMRNHIQKPVLDTENANSADESQLYQARLNLLKLKGAIIND